MHLFPSWQSGIARGMISGGNQLTAFSKRVKDFSGLRVHVASREYHSHSKTKPPPIQFLMVSTNTAWGKAANEVN